MTHFDVFGDPIPEQNTGVIENWDFLPSLIKEGDILETSERVYEYVRGRFVTWGKEDQRDVAFEIEDKIVELGYECCVFEYYRL